MRFKELYRNKLVRFGFWSVLYVLWVIWLGNFWWLIGLAALYELCVSQKLKSWIHKVEEKGSKGLRTLFGWVDAILFAVVVVTFINIFFFQAFKIPSSSMESSLMTGDRLFVSKTAYGPKLPQTPLSVPFVHNTLPLSHKESYSTAIQREYRRLKGRGKVERDDYVVFSFPNGDTVLTKAPAEDYYTHVRMTSREYAVSTFGPVVARPVDKKDHYVKRCVAVAGDTLSIVNGWVYVNSEPQKRYPGIQNTYKVLTDGNAINPVILRDAGISPSEAWFSASLPGYPALALTDSQLEKISSLANVTEVTENIEVSSSESQESGLLLFPFTETGWTRDNYGPLWIPEKGVTVTLTAENMPLYRRIIEKYENNTLEEKDGAFIINGVKSDSYTFKMDYYFMMGDNRHNSLDSRYWGFVPEDHIVGKPAVIWWSTDSGSKFPDNVRWRRLLKILY